LRLGFSLPQVGPQASAENLLLVTRRAEELGYDSLWVLERLLWPLNPREPYPAAPDGELPEAYKIVFDPIETLTFVAAASSKIRLGTSVLVLAYHTPIQLARRLATLDVLSGGRVSLGIGSGWSRDEFEAAGTPFERRGARTSEFLQAMIALWTKNPVSFEGEFYSIPESIVGPKPVQSPHPPIYIAGFGKYTLDRAIQFGAGWNPAGLPSFDWLASMCDQLQSLARQAGRGPMEVVLRISPVVLEKSGGPDRQPTIGTLGEIRDDLKRLADLGVTEAVLSPPELGFANYSDIKPAIGRMEQLIELAN